MYGQLIEQAEKYLRSLYEQDNIAEQLMRKLTELMAAGEANADAACRAMRLSRRTLQRRLRAEKTSFQKVLNEARAVLAVNYLSDERLKSSKSRCCSAIRTSARSRQLSSPGTTCRRPNTASVFSATSEPFDCSLTDAYSGASILFRYFSFSKGSNRPSSSTSKRIDCPGYTPSTTSESRTITTPFTST